MHDSNDAVMFQHIKSLLYSPVIGDILDGMGYWHQFLPQAIQPMTLEMRIVGRAFPVQIADASGKQEKPFGLMTEALDALQESEIYVATGGSMNCAAWGEILTATARTRGSVGAIIDGFHRDTPRVLEQSWPVFSRGRFAQDAGVRSKVVDFRCSVEIGGVRILPGDLMVGDLDGVVVIPSAVEEEVIRLATEKACQEKVVRKSIEAGMSATDAFKKYGIL
jgi:4-hydroxy-4-methyl-2-oxoglutarate aldolase